MKRVILISHGFQTEYELGYTNGLARNGFEVVLIGSDATLTNRLEPTVKCINLRGSQSSQRTKPKKVINIVIYWFKLLKFIIVNRKTPFHVIGMFSVNLFIGAFESWLMRLICKKYILTIHNILPHDKHSKINQILSFVYFRAAHLVLVHSTKMVAILISDYGLRKEKIYFTHHGFDRYHNKIPDKIVTLKKKLGYSEKEKVILFFGNILKYKGLDILIEAFDLLSEDDNLCLLIVGRCSILSLNKALKEQITKSVSSSRIQWINSYVSDDEVENYFHISDVLVLPYRHIYQSGVVFMAYANGIKIVATDVGTLRDYITKEIGMVVEKNNTVALAHSIIKTLELPELTDTEWKRISNPFLWHVTLKQILPIYF